jgi:hypothetical protein
LGEQITETLDSITLTELCEQQHEVDPATDCIE